MYIFTYINKKKSSFNILHANVLNHTLCLLPTFVKFQELMVLCGPAVQIPISKRLSPREGVRGLWECEQRVGCGAGRCQLLT